MNIKDAINEKLRILRMQENLYLLRASLGLSGKDFGELIGVTRQTINNIENGRNKLSKTQYLAIRYAMEHYSYSIAFRLIYNVYILGGFTYIGHVAIDRNNQEVYNILRTVLPGKLTGKVKDEYIEEILTAHVVGKTLNNTESPS